MEWAKLFWIKATQAVYFAHELNALKDYSPLPKTHAFNRLTAFIDSQGVIRVGGRFTQSAFTQEGNVTTGLSVRRVMPSDVSIVDHIDSLSIDRRDGTASYAYRRQVSASRHRARPSRRCNVTTVARIEASLNGALERNLYSAIIKS